jgi:hypothetical protein
MCAPLKLQDEAHGAVPSVDSGPGCRVHAQATDGVNAESYFSLSRTGLLLLTCLPTLFKKVLLPICIDKEQLPDSQEVPTPILGYLLFMNHRKSWPHGL